MPRQRHRAQQQSSDETWQAGRVQLRTWITERGKEPYRPYMVAVVSPSARQVVGADVVASKPSTDEMAAALEQMMAHPKAGAPRRPSRVVVAEPELAAALAPKLAALGIGCVQGETPDLLTAVASFETYLRGKPMPPGLLESPGVTPEQVGRFFAAAAYFYREASWRLLSDNHPIAVRFPADGGETRYAVVMGAAGMSYGLAVYRSLAALLATYAGKSPKTLAATYGNEALNYMDVTGLPFADLDALERYHWEVAGSNAYPVPIILTRRGDIERPGPEDLAWYEAVLRALPRFIKEHLKPRQDLPQPAEAALTVPVGGGEAVVYLRYPPGTQVRHGYRRRDK